MWDGFETQCVAVTTVQHTSREGLMVDLERNTVGEYPGYTGWHLHPWDGVRCPRTDHIEM
jgi:hypothetical protein